MTVLGAVIMNEVPELRLSQRRFNPIFFTLK